MWLSTLQTLGGLAGSHFPKVAKGAADALERLVLEVRHNILCWYRQPPFCLFPLPRSCCCRAMFLYNTRCLLQ